MIKIGYSSCFMYPDPSRTVFGHKTLSYVENDMVRFLSRPGVMPILIPDVSEIELDQYFNEIDALLLQGGADVCPESYGEALIENGKWPGDKYRDKYELNLIGKAIKKNIPILGICRGLQIINVFFKGTLFQDISLETRTLVEHRSAEKYDRVSHEVFLENDSLLKEVYQSQKIHVNSVHHQAIKKLGVDLKIEASSIEDGLIEGIRYIGDAKQFIWAVQWHPEFNHTLGDQVASAEKIANKFLTMIKSRKDENYKSSKS
ncbi:MAG: gamma-glutamyl-gamma-aminobutyrate hydrolase family protein [Halobacteriovoraceae bacterium]|nr:gamma-glutamyl-gamma-aminobutyrate hydrolase family protein [Halobacteriovoraceae bacterium]